MRVGIGVAVVLGLMIAASAAVAQVDQTFVDQCVAGWPEVSASAAQDMLNKYGMPDVASTRLLVWYDRDPWAEILVHRDPVSHRFPMEHEDVLEQVIYYDVPVELYDDLAVYDGSVILERTKGTMAARCDKEEANFLALNLAVDIIEGRKTVEEARNAYGEHIQMFMAGETPEYMTGLQFEPASMAAAASPDEPVIQP